MTAMKNPVALAGANRASGIVFADGPEITTLPAPKSTTTEAVRRISRRFGLPLATAAAVASLAGFAPAGGFHG